MVRRNIGSTYNLTYDVENRLTGVGSGASQECVQRHHTVGTRPESVMA